MIATVLPVGSPETVNVIVPVGGSVGGHGPLYVLFVMVAAAEIVTAALDVEDGAVLPIGTVRCVVGGCDSGGVLFGCDTKEFSVDSGTPIGVTVVAGVEPGDVAIVDAVGPPAVVAEDVPLALLAPRVGAAARRSRRRAVIR